MAHIIMGVGSFLPVSHALPESLGELRQLTVLDLHNNPLTGSLEDQLDGLANLQQLFLQGNQLEGDLSGFCRDVESGRIPRLGDAAVNKIAVNCSCCTCCEF